MSITFTLAVGQVSGSYFAPDTTLNGLINLRLSPYSTASYTGSHIGDGVYSFSSVVPGEYKVYNDTTEMTSFGIIKVGEDTAVLTTGNQTIAGTKTFSTQVVLSAGVQTDTISEKTAGAGVTIDTMLFKDNLTTSNIKSLSGNQTVTGDNTYTGEQTFSVSTYFQNDTGVSPAIYPQLQNSSDAPSEDVHLTPKFYVDDAVASVVVKPYQQSGNIRRVQYGGVTEAGKVYGSIADCITDFGTTSATSRLQIILEKGQADSNYSNLYQLLHSTIDAKGYISITGLTREGTHLILGGTGDSASCTTGSNFSFENMTIYMTTEVADRTYGSISFINCTIYAYRNTNFANCNILNCDVVHANGKTPTLSSAGKCMTSSFSGQVTESSYTGKGVYSDQYDSSPTMPTAPNLGS